MLVETDVPTGGDFTQPERSTFRTPPLAGCDPINTHPRCAVSMKAGNLWWPTLHMQGRHITRTLVGRGHLGRLIEYNNAVTGDLCSVPVID